MKLQKQKTEHDFWLLTILSRYCDWLYRYGRRLYNTIQYSFNKSWQNAASTTKQSKAI